MAIFATAGAKLYIGEVMDADQDLVESDFTSMDWTEITGLENLGSVGDTAQIVTVSQIDRARDIPMKGTRSAGTMEIICSANYSDAGQTAAIAAEKTAHKYGFKLVFADAPAGASPKPSERKFAALVVSASEQLDGPNDTIRLNISLAVASNVVRKNASPT